MSVLEAKIEIGSFDAENYWRDNHLSKLPELVDKERENIILAMDELLFPMCEENDVLITRYSMDSTLKDYLASIGFNFKNNNKNITEMLYSDSTEKKSIFKMMTEIKDRDYFKSLIGEINNVSPFAILDNTKSFCDSYNIDYNLPEYEIVKKVNSKKYSYEVNNEIEVKNKGVIINSSSDLEKEGEKFLLNGPFLVKDLYGVSGKGNLLITSKSILCRIASYLRTQENKGLITEFVVEPLLNKAIDFSCQVNIDKVGNIEIISVQKLINTNFAYQGSTTAEEEFVDKLYNKHYFDVIKKASLCLYKRGYFGNVCFDSMILDDGEIVPIVEINARKSMGLINHYIDKTLLNYKTQGMLHFFSLGFSENITFDYILSQMKKANLLFNPQNGKGIIPLSANTLFINKESSSEAKKVCKGRLYISAVGKDFEEKQQLVKKMREILTSLGLKIYN